MSLSFDQQATTDIPNPSPAPASHRVSMLDDSDRQTIITLISTGFSRRAAAHWVGCSPATVTRTAQRDPAFAARIAQASRFMQLEALQGIRKAIANPRYWRAAAWLLERIHPDDYGPRLPGPYANKAMLRMFQQFIAVFLGEVPRANLGRVVHKLEQMIREQEWDAPSTDPPEFRDSPAEMLYDDLDDESGSCDGESDNLDDESDDQSDDPDDQSDCPDDYPDDPKSSDESGSPVVSAPRSADSGQPSPTPSSFCNNPAVGCGDVPLDALSTTCSDLMSCALDDRPNPCNTNRDALNKPPGIGSHIANEPSAPTGSPVFPASRRSAAAGRNAGINSTDPEPDG